MDGLIFGMIDNGVLLLGAYTGLEIDRFFEGRGALGAVIGAGVGNTVSDGVGALIDPSLAGMFAGIVIGCIVPLFAIPVIEYFKPSQEVAE
jgi:hypothetical protein